MTQQKDTPNCFSVRQNNLNSQPMAFVYWKGSEAFIIPVKAENNHSIGQLQSYVGYRSTFPPFIIERESLGNKIQLKSIPIALDDYRMAINISNQLTFSTQNKNKFIFLPYHATQEELKNAIHLVDGYLYSNFLSYPRKYKSALKSAPMIQCACAGEYRVFESRCPKCGRWDVLGHLWKHEQKKIIEHMNDTANKVIAKIKPSPVIGAISQGSTVFIDLFNKSEFEINDQDDQAKIIQKLLGFFDSLMCLKLVDKSTLNIAEKLPQEVVKLIISEFIKISILLRRHWDHNTFTGWFPTSEFVSEVSDGIKEYCLSVVKSLKEAGGTFAVASIMYAPIRDNLQEQLNPGFWKGLYNQFRWFMAGFNAAATFGLSLALKAGSAILKDKKQQERFDKFIDKVGNLAEKCADLNQNVETLQQFHTGIFPISSPFLINHSLLVMAHDYAKRSDEQRIQMVLTLARTTGITDWEIPDLNPPGKWKRIFSYFIIFVIISLIVILLKYFKIF